MIKRLIILIFGIYLGAIIGLDRINKVTVYCVEKVKAVYSTIQEQVKEQETGETNESK